ncbi:MAG: hypothetical protein P1P65_03580 [Treponema sp.]
MKKTDFVCGCVFLLFTVSAFAEELRYISPKTSGLDIELSRVNLVASVFNEDRIAYRYELSEGKKLSCIETQKTFRVRQLMPSEGTLYLFIPKAMLLANCSIRSSRADIVLEKVQAVHLLIMMNGGAVSFKEGRFKNTVINLAQGKLTLDNTSVIRSAAVAVSSANADILLAGSEADYHIDYVHNGSSFMIGSQEYVKNPGQYGNPAAKRRIIFSGSASSAAIRFTEKETAAQ